MEGNDRIVPVTPNVLVESHSYDFDSPTLRRGSGEAHDWTAEGNGNGDGWMSVTHYGRSQGDGEGCTYKRGGERNWE